MAQVPVLLQEVIKYLDPQPGDTVVDGTINRGGHALPLCRLIGPTGKLVGIDENQAALEEAKKNLAACTATTYFLKGNFRALDKLLKPLGLKAVNVVLLDLGFSSDQLESSGRGFSFKRDEPLLMTFGEPTPQSLTAGEVLNHWSEKKLADTIYCFGEETFARRIAKQLVAERRRESFKTTGQLVAAIRRAVPSWYTKRRIHFATKTFQALRIAVNDELAALAEGLTKGFDLLVSGGRLGVISFHSLEARPVKNTFQAWQKDGRGRLLTKKAVKPSRAEQLENPRSRSAQLRVIKKL